MRDLKNSASGSFSFTFNSGGVLVNQDQMPCLIRHTVLETLQGRLGRVSSLPSLTPSFLSFPHLRPFDRRTNSTASTMDTGIGMSELFSSKKSQSH